MHGDVYDDLDNLVTIDAEDEYPLPDPKSVEPDGVLYHSGRDYWTQLLAYWEHKINGDDEVDLTWLEALAEAEQDGE